MNCREITSLILAERDGALTPTERAALSDHLAACPACRELRTQLATSLEAYRAGVASVQVPDVDAAWRDLQAEIHAPARRAKKRPLAPVIWFGAPLVAAAAALAMVFLVGGSPFARPVAQETARMEVATANPLPPPPPPPASAPAFVPPPLSTPYDPSIIAGADYVEAGDPNASTMVYVDKESGWLVVWATDMDIAPARG
jgi:hypothetical protein